MDNIHILKEKYMNQDIVKTRKNGNAIHFSEFSEEFKQICFYKIFEKNGEKLISFETSSYKNPAWSKIKVLDYNNVFINCETREDFCELLAKNELKLNKPKQLTSNIVPIKYFADFGSSENIPKLTCLNSYYIEPDKVFYNNDILLFNYGDGRKLIDLNDINSNTPVGSYYSKKTLLKDKEDSLTLTDYILMQ